MWVWLWVGRALACDTVVMADTLAMQLMQAQHDPEAPARARAMLPCLAEAITPLDAALYHRVMARDALVRGADSEAISEMRAARAADPAWNPSPALARLYARSEPQSAAPALASGRAVVDGVDGALVYVDRAAIVQSVEDGEWRTRYLVCVGADDPKGEEAPIPAAPIAVEPLPVEPLPAAVVVAAPRPLRPGHRGIRVGLRSPVSVPFVVTGAALGVGAVVAFGRSAELNAQFHDLDNAAIQDQDDLAALGAQTNVAAAAAIAGAVLGAACLAAGTVTITFH